MCLGGVDGDVDEEEFARGGFGGGFGRVGAEVEVVGCFAGEGRERGHVEGEDGEGVYRLGYYWRVGGRHWDHVGVMDVRCDFGIW